jgi:uncharacterized iron-regulated protein
MRKSGVTEWWSDKGGNEAMKNSIGALLLCALFLIADSSVLAQEPLQLYDISNRKVETLNSIVHRLSESRIVLVGEHHREPSHHRLNCRLSDPLQKAGSP